MVEPAAAQLLLDAVLLGDVDDRALHTPFVVTPGWVGQGDQVLPGWCAGRAGQRADGEEHRVGGAVRLVQRVVQVLQPATGPDPVGDDPGIVPADLGQGVTGHPAVAIRGQYVASGGTCYSTLLFEMVSPFVAALGEPVVSRNA